MSDAWRFWLIPQDAANFDPHITIQNKAEPRQARALVEALSADFSAWVLRIDGLSLWRYCGGPWEKLRDLRFS